MIKILLFLLVMSSISYAKVNQGEAISADKMNSQTFDVGSIQQSVLIETVFQSRNGDCWVLMDGSPLAITDELRQLTGWTNLPDARGRILRMTDLGANVDAGLTDRTKLTGTYTGNESYIGSSQNDEVGPHTHELQGKDDSGTNDYAGGSGANYGLQYNGGSFATSTQENTGTETRMKNINVNMYIKIKESCTYSTIP